MVEKCFNCGIDVDNETDIYAVLVGSSGSINFCESCGKTFNIQNWYNTNKSISKIIGKCAKQETIAIIENNGQYWIGTNWCKNAQNECPRIDMETGVGYELCKNVCEQLNHAEVDACIKAGKNSIGGTLYLIGHTYCCDNCKKVMSEYGIKEIVIGQIPQSIFDKVRDLYNVD